MVFADGQLYERTLDTAAGTIEILAEIVVHGARIERRDIAIYPRGPGPLTISPAELLRAVRPLKDELADAGFEQLRLTGTRLSGARRGRRVELLIDLRKALP